jgi:hypothetical protein
MKKTDQSQPSRDSSGAVRGSGRSSEREERRPGVPGDSVRNSESPSEKNRSERTRPTQDDLILHDDDEAELELPR